MRFEPATRTAAKMLVVAAAAIGSAGVTASVGGCGSPVTGPPLAKEMAGDDPQAQMDFWHTLPTRAAVTNDEAFHALLLFLDGQDPAADYAGRVTALRARGMLPGGFADKPEAAVRRGTLAVALVRGLAIPGGLTMRVFGPQPRYAERELEYAGLYPPGSPHQTFSGAELLGIIGRAEDYQRGKDAESQVPEQVVGGGGRDGPGTRPAGASGSVPPAPEPAPPAGPATVPASLE
jgi:hypothetical protein